MEATIATRWVVVTSPPISDLFKPSYWKSLREHSVVSVRVIPLIRSFILDIHAAPTIAEIWNGKEESSFKALLQHLDAEDWEFLQKETKTKDKMALLRRIDSDFNKVDSYLPTVHFVLSNGDFYEKTCKLPNLTHIYAQQSATDKHYVPWIEQISSEWAWSLSWLEDRNFKYICLPSALPLAVRSVWNTLSISTISDRIKYVTDLEELASEYGLSFKVSRVSKTGATHGILYEEQIGTGEYIIKLLRLSNDLFAAYIEDFVQLPSIDDIERRWHELEKQLHTLSKHHLYHSTLENSVVKFATYLDKVKKIPLQRVAIIGKTKSGKSTLINSIIGCQILPEAGKHQQHSTTKVPTFIHYADQKGFAISFDTLDIEATLATMKALSLEELIAAPDEVNFRGLLQGDEALDLEQLREALHVIGNGEESADYSVQNAIDKWNDHKAKVEELQKGDTADTKEELTLKLQELCCDPDLAFVIKAIHIYGKFPHIQGIELIDMPGFEDTSENINIQTSKLLKEESLQHIFYLFSSNIQKDDEAIKRIESYRGERDIDTTILLRAASDTQIAEYPKLTFQFIEPWKAAIHKQIKVVMNYGSVDAKLANTHLHDSDYEKLGISQIRRVLKMISHSALLELDSRLSHLVDRATELFLQNGSNNYDTTLFEHHMGEFKNLTQHYTDGLVDSLQALNQITEEQYINYVYEHLRGLCNEHGKTLRSILSKASFDMAHKASSGKRFNTIDTLMMPIAVALDNVRNQLWNNSQIYQQTIQRQLQELCNKVALPYNVISVFVTRHFRTVARYFRLYVDFGNVRKSLVSILRDMLLRMAQVDQRSKTVGEAARRILDQEFPSLDAVLLLAKNTWSSALNEHLASLQSEISTLEQDIRLAFIRSKTVETNQLQLEYLQSNKHLTSTLRIPQVVTQHEASQVIIHTQNVPVLLHVGAFNRLTLNFSSIGHLLGKTKFLHLETESASYFDLYYKSECYNSFLPENLENVLQSFFGFQQCDDIKRNIPILQPQGSPLGEGAYGQVFKVVYGSQHFAIKKIVSQKSGEVFEQEKKALIQLTHPRIIPLLAYDVDDHCLVMPWMAGGDLHKIVQLRKLTPQFVLKIAYQIADGLAYLHSKSWMHRDLKSHNILLTANDETANCVISDFGSAKLYEQGAKNTLKVGTNPYMAPEVANEEYALSADIYSFGAVLLELITNKVLVTANSIAEFLLDPIAKEHPLYPVVRECCERTASARPTATKAFENISSIVVRSVPCFNPVNDFNYICTWVRYRVLHSNTQYPIRSPNSGTQLLTSFRVAVMLQYLESDVERLWSEDQKRLIAQGLRNQTYCRDLSSADKLLLHNNLTLEATHCIYFYVNATGECYVGKTDRMLRIRHKEHVNQRNSNFDRRMKEAAWSNVQPIPICIYEDYSQMTRYEVLHVLVFNTAKIHDARGLNTMLGGDFGASNKLVQEESELAEMMGKVQIK